MTDLPSRLASLPSLTRLPLSRRTLVGAGAWAIPAVAASLRVPVTAASTTPTVTVTTPDNSVPAAGAKAVTTTLTTEQGQPRAGQSVSLLGPRGSAFSAPNGTTDGAGQYVTNFDLGNTWAYPGSTATVTAVTSSDSGVGAFTVVGANLIQVAASGGSFAQSQMPLSFPSPVVHYASVVDSHFAVLADGTLWGRGRKAGGAFTRQTTLTDVTFLAASNSYAGTYYALRRDGSVWAWGSNSAGQLGDGTTTDRWTPAPVPGLSDVIKVAATNSTLFAVKSDNTAWAVGGNFFAGRAGVGSTADTVPLTQMVNGTDVVDIVGRPSLGGMFLKSDGTVWTWGGSSRGYLGLGSANTTGPERSPVNVPGLSDIASITIGMGAVDWSSATLFVLDRSGAAWGWGDNNGGVLGSGFSGSRASSPVALAGLSGATQIAVNNGIAFAILSDGSVRAWGNGQATPTPFTPTQPIASLQRICNASAYDTTLSLIVAEPAG